MASLMNLTFVTFPSLIAATLQFWRERGISYFVQKTIGTYSERNACSLQILSPVYLVRDTYPWSGSPHVLTEMKMYFQLSHCKLQSSEAVQIILLVVWANIAVYEV